LFQLLALPGRRTVDEDIEPVEARQRLLDQSPNRLLVGQLRLQGNGINPAGAEMGHRFLGLDLRTAIVDGERITARRHCLRDVPADAALAAAGHQSHLGWYHRSPRRIANNPWD